MLNAATQIYRATDQVQSTDRSFLSDFFEIGPDRIAKVYKSVTPYPFLNMDDPEARDALMEREICCLDKLSPALESGVGTVIRPDGEQQKGIVMRKLPSEWFLDRRLADGEQIPGPALQLLAERIIDFHFDPTVCSQIRFPEGELVHFCLNTIVRNQTDVLGRLAERKGSKISELEDWLQSAECFVHRNAQLIELYGEILGEPVRGHGDIKSSNIALSSQGEVYVLDTAPYYLWQINTRGMDASFFRTELDLMGRTAESDIFWNSYCRAFDSKLEHRTPHDCDKAGLRNGMQALDVLAQFYHSMIFFGLTFLDVNSERATAAQNKLQMAVQQMKQGC